MAAAAAVMNTWTMVLVVMVSAVTLEGGKWAGVAARVHHVVGGDRGWDPSTDVAAWSSGRTFRVGDNIWFTYSAAQGTIAELETKEDYDSCDVSNPIRMYTDGINSVSLEGEGIRYFASSDPMSCKNGLKLHVEVLPQHEASAADAVADDSSKMYFSASSEAEASSLLAAAGPTPSASAQVGASFATMFLAAGFWVWLGYNYMVM